MTKPNGHGQSESIITFPCDFTLKIVGKSEGDFEKIVLAIVREHFPTVTSSHIQKKFSKDQNYLSLSVTVYARSKMELDALYQSLSSTKEVLMVL
jgi:putative lipoic acid-binding regulatory protein